MIRLLVLGKSLSPVHHQSMCLSSSFSHYWRPTAFLSSSVQYVRPFLFLPSFTYAYTQICRKLAHEVVQLSEGTGGESVKDRSDWYVCVCARVCE